MQHIFQAVVLGIIQGITEFIPISSSGHLVITKYFLGWHELGGKTFDLAVHFGTLLSLFLYFWKDIVRYAKAFFLSVKERKIGDDTDRKLVWLLLLSALPGFIFGGLFDDYLEAKFNGPLIVAFNLAFFGILLFLADHYGKDKDRPIEKSNMLDAVVIGLSQAIALIPGVSRSGITMTAGIFRKFTREAAARFSFLMLIPIVSGAVVYKFLKVIKAGELSQVLNLTYLTGILTAFISGYICIAFLLNYLKRKSFDIFVLYRIGLAAVIVLLYFLK
ncbi:MAG: undecaprenyl-diphosphatase UppP [Armatimonadota bacterium]